MKSLYEKCAFAGSKTITENYSTSFTLGIKTLDSKYHDAIFGIYGMVRLADEIVDTFHDSDKAALLAEFKEDTFKAIDRKISLNPVLHAYQWVVNKYGIDRDLTEAFFHSMEMDLENKKYGEDSYTEYIYGSAEVVGLMCLKVFCEGDPVQYEKLKMSARSLGAAFQKVNFLRDLKSDFVERGRTYFPELSLEDFNENSKMQIEADIERDFNQAYLGIIQLPEGARTGVYLAYRYYISLFDKIRKTKAEKVMQSRLRVPDIEKLWLLSKSLLRGSVNIF